MAKVLDAGASNRDSLDMKWVTRISCSVPRTLPLVQGAGGCHDRDSAACPGYVHAGNVVGVWRTIASEAGIQVTVVKNACSPVGRVLVTVSGNTRILLEHADRLAADVAVMLAAVVPYDQVAGVVAQFDPAADAALPLPEVVGVVNAGLILLACALVPGEHAEDSNWLLLASQINAAARVEWNVVMKTMP